MSRPSPSPEPSNRSFLGWMDLLASGALDGSTKPGIGESVSRGPTVRDSDRSARDALRKRLDSDSPPSAGGAIDGVVYASTVSASTVSASTVSASTLSKLTDPPRAYPDESSHARRNPTAPTAPAIARRFSGAGPVKSTKPAATSSIAASARAAGKPLPESSTLSYEQALRRHGRPRPATVASAPSTVRPAKLESAANPISAASPKANGNAIPSVSPRTNATAAVVPPKPTQPISAQPQSAKLKQAKPQALRASSKPVPVAMPVSQQSPPPEPKSHPSRRHRKAASAAAPDSPSFSSRLPIEQVRAPAKRSASVGASPPAVADPPLRQTASATPVTAPVVPVKSARTQSESVALRRGRRTALAQLESGLDRKRSILSVRVTDGELTLLKSRAEECGVSVSSYMRSCVLEAEHLRSQVKQALAEMRTAAHAQDHTRDSMSLTDGAGRVRQIGSGWRHFLVRSTSFFFGPWFAARRKT